MANEMQGILQNYTRGDRSSLIPILQETQLKLGYISPEMVDQIASFTGAAAGDVFGVASFYSQFRYNKPAQHAVKVCLGTACHVRGGDRIMETVQRELKIKEGESTSDGQYSLEKVSCFGCCAIAPVVVVDKEVNGRMNTAKALKLLKKEKL